ncbi:very short patch repair endonuclease [Zophobihabitans entericus]|uniref:Very short patch repair endonuclease n=1 Tax=Zophobihabitans entericus TaxID=1635327 RepID=A0A6G9IB10_9GAMM|nr:DNA mismatch endonuclease Vsr [Zophobihabitans entericus]QIQ21012.1 DNA mismatch endonuclease Vsr [Zophobihabitans entericus]
MADVHDKATRSKNMQAIKTEDTFIEQRMTQLLSSLGVEFQVQVKELPGKPDFVIDYYKAIIFTHGCFWHRHDCHLFKIPQTRTEFWLNKIEDNRQRDRKVIHELTQSDWKVLIIWECAIRGKHKLSDLMLSERIEEWLCSYDSSAEIGTLGMKKYLVG